MVKENGWNSTSHQVLDPGMNRWFSAAGDAVVGYAQVAGYRVAAGAPVAPDARLAAVAAEFETASRAAGSRVSYFAAEERFVAATEGRYAMHVIGHQPAWNAGSWAERFDAERSLRAQRNRAANKGVTAEERPMGELGGRSLRDCHAAWLNRKRLPRLGFLAHSRPSAVAEVAHGRRLFVATSPAGRVEAFLTACPVPRRRGWLFDTVVRRPDAPNGTAELLIDAAARTLAAVSERLTLGLAPLSGVIDPEPFRTTTDGTEPGTPTWLRRAERAAVVHGRELYDFAGLYAFKRKFKPDSWEPVYLLTAAPRFGVGNVLALATAFLVA